MAANILKAGHPLVVYDIDREKNERIAVIEALVLGAKAGLDPQTMVDVIGRSTGNSVAFQYTAPRVVSRDFDGIRMDITYKDLELQTTLAKHLKAPLFLATICQQIYQMEPGRRAGRRRWRRNRQDL
jgi:3-hydroxyisobutyrate dehydrogenase-like beta-hydroxyacid dehydrogenase